MKLLGKLCASLLVLVIGVTVLAYVLTATLLNAHYLEAKASSIGLYDSLAQQIPNSVASGSGVDQQAVQQTLAGVVTGKYVESKINPFLDSLQAYYQSNGPAPQMSLSDLALQMQSQGITVSPDSPLAKPIVYKDPAGVKKIFDWLNLIKIAGPIIGLLLLAALMLLYHGWHRITAVVKVCLTAAVFEGLMFGLFKLAPGIVDSITKSKINGNPLAGIFLTFAKSLLGSVANDFGKAAIGLVLAGALALIIGFILKTAGFFTRHTHAKEATVTFERQNAGNRPRMS